MSISFLLPHAALLYSMHLELTRARLSHPRYRQDYVGLIGLGLVAEFTRRLSKYFFPWAEKMICVRAASSALDPSHDWLLSYWIARKEWIERAKRLCVAGFFPLRHVVTVLIVPVDSESETSTIAGAARAMPCEQSERFERYISR